MASQPSVCGTLLSFFFFPALCSLQHKNKINRSGELILTSESSRYQFRNLADCLQKIRDMIAEASQMPKEPSQEDAQLWKMRYQEKPPHLCQWIYVHTRGGTGPPKEQA